MMPSTWTCVSPEPDDTRQIGRWLGQAVQCPIVVTLDGDLGAGKTVLVQGIADGLAVPPDIYVTSPTYTLVAVYPGRLPLVHADLYRLIGPVDPEELGLALDTPDGVIAVEWAGRLDASAVGDHLKIILEAIDDDRRRLTMTAYGLDPTVLLKKIAACASVSMTTDATVPERR